MNKTAVVFGATGLVGKELVSQLLDGSDYDKVVTVVREALPIYDARLVQIRLHDFLKLMKLEEKLSADTYFCCIGTTISKAGSKANFRLVDFTIPQKIALLAEKLSVPNLVVISSLGADSGSSNFYLRTKGEMEESVKEIYKGHLEFVRPSLLIGHREDFRLGEVVAVAFMKIFKWIFIGPLREYRGVSAFDVARKMITLSKYGDKD